MRSQTADDPEAVATETYYLPLAALQLRQAVGRLIRSERHCGAIVISDRKLAGATALRRAYRQTFLGSLDVGLLRPDADTGEPAGGNVTTMADGWRRIRAFFAPHGPPHPQRATHPATDDKILARFCETPLDIWRRNPLFWHGSIHGGLIGPSQSGAMRPVPGWADYRMPLPGLYLTGASSHPGGSVSAAPGRNAVMVMFKDFGTSIPEVLRKKTK